MVDIALIVAFPVEDQVVAGIVLALVVLAAQHLGNCSYLEVDLEGADNVLAVAVARKSLSR